MNVILSLPYGANCCNPHPIYLSNFFLLYCCFLCRHLSSFTSTFYSYLMGQNENNGLSLFCGSLAIIIAVDIFYVSKELSVCSLVLCKLNK